MENKPTDSDLNELLATRVMGWAKSELNGWPFYRDGNIDLCHYDQWNPCHDYNHLRQVEEALTNEQLHLYVNQWQSVVVFANTTARQRCDAIAKVVSDV